MPPIDPTISESRLELALRRHVPDPPDLEGLVERLTGHVLNVLNPHQPTAIETVSVAVGDSDALRLHHTSLAQEPIPERLDHFRIVRLIGRGGMGAVYQAQDTRLGREVAVKTLRQDLAKLPGAKERFMREARLAASLGDDHIIPVFHVGEYQGIPYLAMPLLKGQGLDDRLKEQGPIPPDLAMQFGIQIARGLAAAHARGMIHRDIKPANIWIEPIGPGRARILDFGLARVTDGTDVTLTASGAIIGTPAYMAPEQARGEKVDHRADLFSLGVVLYQMLTGVRPFRGNDHLAILSSLALDTPPEPHVVNPQVPATLSAYVMYLLAKDPSQRPGSATHVAQALELLANGQIVAIPVPVRTSTDNPFLDLDSMEASTEAIPASRVQAKKRQRPLAAIVLALTMLSAGVLAYGVYARVFMVRQGTLVVELADRETEARFKNGELEIISTTGGNPYRLRPSDQKRMSLPPGEYQIVLEGYTSLQLSTDTVTITKGQETTVRVMPRPRDDRPDGGSGAVARLARGSLPPIEPIVSPYLTGPSPMDRLDAANIPERLKFPGMPSQVVAAYGDRQGVFPTDPYNLKISPNGRWASAGMVIPGHEYRLIWDLETLEPFFIPGTQLYLNPVVTNEQILAIEKSRVAIIRLDQDQPRFDRYVAQSDDNVGYSCIAKVPGQPRLFTGRHDGQIALWDLATAKGDLIAILQQAENTRDDQFHNVLSLTVSQDGSTLAAKLGRNGDDQWGEIQIWDLVLPRPRLRMRVPAYHTGDAPSLLISKNGHTLVHGYYFAAGREQIKHISLWDISGDEPKLLLRDPLERPNVQLARVMQWWDESKLEVVIDYQHSHQVWSLQDGGRWIKTLPAVFQSLAEDARTMVLRDQNALVLANERGEVIRRGNTPRFWSMSRPLFLGSRLYAFGTGPSACDIHKGDFAAETGTIPAADWPTLAEWSEVSPDRRWVIGNMANLYAFANDRYQHTSAQAIPTDLEPGEHPMGILQARIWQPDGKAIIEAYKYGGIFRWSFDNRLVNQQKLGAHTGVQQVTWSTDGQTLVTAGGPYMQLWDLTHREPRYDVIDKPGFMDSITSGFLEPGGKAVWMADGFARVSRTEIGKKELTHDLVFNGMGSELMLSPNGKTVAAYHTRNGWTFWDLETRKTLARWDAGPHHVLAGRWAEDGRHFHITQYGAVYVLRIGDTLPGEPVGADRALAERILALGGTFSSISRNGFVTHDQGQPIPDGPFQIKGINLAMNTQVTDEVLKQIARLQELDTLVLSNTAITEAGIAEFASFPKLQAVYLNGLPITDAHLPLFARLPLKKLHLADTRVTDAGVQTLAKFKDLDELNLHGGTITDAALGQLHQMASLRELYLTRTAITEATVRELATQLPACKITWEGGVIEPSR